MARLKLEKVAGVVALSYLVIIPVTLAVLVRKANALESDVETLWMEAQIPNTERVPVQGLRGLWDWMKR